MNIPKGYKLVPVKPTKEILEELTNGNPSQYKVIKFRWDQMLAAAPTPPQPIFDEAADLVAFEKWVNEECERDDAEPDFSLADNGEYENDTLNIARRAWLAGAQSHAKAGEVRHE